MSPWAFSGAQSAYTADQIAAAYGFSGLYAAGNEGAGTTVAVYELEPDDPGDITAFQRCYGTRAPVRYVHVDGGAGAGAGSDEAAFDIENLIGFAPAASVLVYQGPNSNSGAPGSGPYDTFSAIVNQDRAQVVSVSWGQCEASLGRANAVAESTLFQQAAVQGQSIVAAAGDNGAEDCNPASRHVANRAAVDDPASQPLVTGVGGTTLRAIGPPPVETVWNSGGSVAAGQLASGAGGGGVSALWPMSAAQASAGATLGVRSPLVAGSHCGQPRGYCRAVPDVAADSDPSTGYEVYWNGADTIGGQPVGWQGLGGTSGAAPVWAALLALADASPNCRGAPIGYANPALYRAATDAYAADFHDVTTGENDLTGANFGRFAAGPGFDLATGLGTPNASALVQSLCAHTVRLDPISGQSSAIGAAVSLALHATDTPGAAPRYSAAGLPVGLKLDATTGEITGTPARRGEFTVRAGVRDSAGARATISFSWGIGAAPGVSPVSVAGPRLSFTVSSPRGGPSIHSLQVSVPRTLRIRSERGIVLGAGRSEQVEVRVVRRVVSFTLSPATAAAQITLGPPGLTAVSRHGPQSAPTGFTRGSLDLVVGAGSTGASRLTAALGSGG